MVSTGSLLPRSHSHSPVYPNFDYRLCRAQADSDDEYDADDIVNVHVEQPSDLDDEVDADAQVTQSLAR